MLEQEPRDQQPQRAGGAVGGALGSAAAAVPDSEDPGWIEARTRDLDGLCRTSVEPRETARRLLGELARWLGVAQGAVYSLAAAVDGAPARLELAASHAAGADLPVSFVLGEGLIGQCALERRKLVIHDVPDRHFRVRSGLGSSTPRQLFILPLELSEACLFVIELAFVRPLSRSREALLDRLSERRSGAGGAVSEPLPGSTPPAPPEPGRSSQRFGFWRKLSHELRSPLNSVLVLSKALFENADRNLTPRQIAFAEAIHSSGNELLALVNAISDLFKIEADRLVLEPTEMGFEPLRAHLERTFEPIARARGLGFVTAIEPSLRGSIVTDAKRVRQIMTCLLSNAFKFTETGGVSVSMGPCSAGWSRGHARLDSAREVIALRVRDTGVGISEGEQRSLLTLLGPDGIDGWRGTAAGGLGLAISRQLARLLGGELQVTSLVGSGSTFTLYLPADAPDALGDEHERRGDGAAGAAPSTHAPSLTLALGSPGAQPSSEPPPQDTQLSGLCVWIVDEDVRSAYALTGLLEHHGAEVAHADGTAQLLQRLDEGARASALLVDAEQLEGAGYDAFLSILERHRALRVIVLTRSTATPAEPARAVPSHIPALQKPVDQRQLVSRLRELLPWGGD